MRLAVICMLLLTGCTHKAITVKIPETPHIPAVLTNTFDCDPDDIYGGGMANPCTKRFNGKI